MLYHQKYDLQPRNSLAVPSVCDFFCTPASMVELAEAIQKSKELKLPLKILGEGSNVLLSEQIHGFVLSPSILGKRVLSENEHTVIVEVGAGENWTQFVSWCLSHTYFGLENLNLIPGSVGAAPIQNIGAYGVEQDSCFEGLTAIEVDSGETVEFNFDDCEFSYRESVFKTSKKNKYIITNVQYRLSKVADVNLSYPVLKNYFSAAGVGDVTPKMVADAVAVIRTEKLPDPVDIPNAGSFFKNPIISVDDFTRLLTLFPSIVGFEYIKDGVAMKKLAAGWLIEYAGWKGKSIQGVVVHPRQALVLTNPDRLSSQSIFGAEQQIIDDIKKRFGVSLEREPQVL